MKTVFVASLIILLFSCKKDSSGGYHFTCTIDGVSRSFNFYATAHREDDQGGIYGISVGGAENSSQNGDSFGFWIDNMPGGHEIAAGTYDDGETEFSVLSTFSQNGAGIDWEAGTEVVKEANTYGGTITNHLQVVITQIDSKTIRGTITGDFYKNGDAKGEKKTITNGDFYLKFY